MQGLDLSKAKRRPASMIRHADSECPDEYDLLEGHLNVGSWIECEICWGEHEIVSVIHTEIVG